MSSRGRAAGRQWEEEEEEDGQQRQSVTVCAPGKVLLAGGYLVLERPNSGMVIGASARFFSTAVLSVPASKEEESWVTMQEPGSSDSGSSSSASSGKAGSSLVIAVYSPQFHTNFAYMCSWPSETELPSLTPLLPDQDDNPYVEHTLTYTMGFLRGFLPDGALSAKLRHMAERGLLLRIKLRADNDFYSQTHEMKARGLAVSAESLASLPPFLPCPKQEDGTVLIAKTGMGSSAALITSLVGCLLSFFEAVAAPGEPVEAGGGKGLKQQQEEEERGLSIVHNLAQICHGIAQGKVGSGFDVSAAVYGSHEYTRFSPSIIEKVLAGSSDGGGGEEQKQSPGAYPELLQQAVCREWDCERAKVALPADFRLLMGDVSGGSSTPSMVRKVLAWKRASSTAMEAEALWAELAAVNASIVALVREIHDLSTMDGAAIRGVDSEEATEPNKEEGAAVVAASAFKTDMAALAGQCGELWPSVEAGAPDGNDCDSSLASLLRRLRAAFARARELLRHMGEAAGVPIEPPEQTALANATAALPGVVCAGVPGAGGVDAIYAIAIGQEAVAGVESLWASWGGPGTSDGGGSGVGGVGAARVCPLSLRASTEGLRWSELGWDGSSR